jgi:hypothetical protein
MEHQIATNSSVAETDTSDQDLLLAEQALDWSVSDVELEQRISFDKSKGTSGSC